MALKILMFGETGQVAAEICRAAAEDPTLSVTALSRAQADLSQPEACAAIIAGAEADLIINAAAYTAVDRAEEEEALATRINGAAPGAMAEAAAARNLPFLHVSTDYVFDGGGDAPWRESDPTGPLGAYGRSKLAGEEAVMRAGGRPIILRTAWVHAAHGANFVKTMLRVGADRDELAVVDDQYGGPTAAHDIAATLLQIGRRMLDGDGEPGLYHYCGAPSASWREFAQAIFDGVDWPKKPTVNAIRTEDWPTPAKRPGNSRLDCSKIKQVFGVDQPDWRQSLQRILIELEERSA